MKNLVIVESPAKAKTIAKYLNSNKNLKSLGTFIVVSSMGHIRDLKKKELGIDIDKGFLPNYQVTEEKSKVVTELKNKAKECDLVWIASDYDREGEGIAMHLKEVLKLKKYKRITFTEITSKALEQAIMNPRKIDDNLVDSQETRRILDRLVGFKLSPVLWKKYKTENMSGLSAGRVQSAVMHIILQREHEIKNFDSGSYWYFIGDFALKIKSEKHDMSDVKLYKSGTVYKEDDQKEAHNVLKKLKNDFKIIDVKSKEAKRNADLPFITSTLQQEGHAKYGFPLKRTMQLAQELYEKGYITYMRTDSYNISDDFKATAEKFILDQYGAEYYSGGSAKKKVIKNAQEAHEAIRPTHVDTLAETLDLSIDHKKLYDIIWKRTVAYFMTPCIYDELEIKVTDSSFGKDIFFQSTFSKVKFNGYMIVYGVKSEKYDFQKYIDGIKEGKYDLKCKTITAKNTWQSPPARYNESSIIKALEAEGIGRPSTYAGIMNKLFEKKYILKSDVSGVEKSTTSYVFENGKIKQENGSVTIGQERTRLVPTDIGEEIDKFLSENFDYIVDKRFTASMEADLDKIAEGDKKKLDVLNIFWNVFKKDLSKFDTFKEKKVLLKTESMSYNINGKDYILRIAKYGPVIEYQGDTKKVFINLKPFMKHYRKELTDVTQEDVEFILSLPKVLCNVDKKPFMFVYGPYGFYGKYDDRNIKIPLKLLNAILKDDYTIDDIRRCIEYKKEDTTGTSGSSTATKTSPVKKIVKKVTKATVK